MHLVPYRYRTKLGAKRAELEQSCEDSCHEVASEFFKMNAPDPCHWTLNSCFTAFSTVWLYLGLFLYCKKQGANRAELVQLMQKFVQRSGVKIIRNEGTRSIPLDPNLMF